MLSLVNVTGQGDPLTNNNFLTRWAILEKDQGSWKKLTLLCEENRLAKILNAKSSWMGNMTAPQLAEKEQDLTVKWLFSTKHLTSRQ